MVNIVPRIRQLVDAVLPRRAVRWDVPFVGIENVPRVVVVSEHMNATYFATFHYTLQYLQSQNVLDFAMLSGAGVERALSHCRPDALVEWLVNSTTPQIVIFSRYAAPCAKALLEAFQSHRVPVLYYCDDNLLDLPDTLGSGVIAAHGTEPVRDARRFCLARVDRVLASTGYLATRLRTQFPSQRVTEICYPPYLASLIRKASRKDDRRSDKQVTIGYMGSRGHQGDLEMVVPTIMHILRQFQHVRFETFGTVAMPTALRCFGERVAAHSPRRTYGEFLQFQYDLGWDIGLAPLKDNDFNRCRSPIKFVEYTACDIVTVASNTNVYSSVIGSNPGLVADEHGWGAVLEQMVMDTDLRWACLGRARSICAERYHLPDVSRGLAKAMTLEG